MSVVVIFFFQAEDGIRDSPVTGVQTCALPIFQNKVEGTAHHVVEHLDQMPNFVLNVAQNNNSKLD